MHVADNARLENRKSSSGRKNREDGSDVEEIQTKNRSDASCLMKNFRTNETNKKFPQNSKKYRFLFEKF